MTELEFNALCVIVFVLVVIGVSIGFTYFVKWFKRDTTQRPTTEALLQRQAEIDDRFRRLHPEVDDESSGS